MLIINQSIPAIMGPLDGLWKPRIVIAFKTKSTNFYFNKNIHLSPYNFKYGQRILKNQYILISRFQILFEINMKYFFQFHLKQNTFWHFIVCNWSISSVWQKLPKVIKSRTKQIVDICSYKYNIKYNSMNRLSLVYFKVQSLSEFANFESMTRHSVVSSKFEMLLQDEYHVKL